MELFGRAVLSPDALWETCARLLAEPGLWKATRFPAAARAAGLTRVQKRSSFFTFAGPELTGQAPLQRGHVEELRLFLGRPPAKVSPELFEADQPKLGRLAAAYAKRLRAELGPSRRVHENHVFERDGFRVRVVATWGEVWVVLSKLEVVEALGLEDWK